MKTRQARSWTAALLALSFLAVTPAKAVIIDVEPDDYAPGTDITHAVDGVSLYHYTYDRVADAATMEPIVVHHGGNCESNPDWCIPVTGTNTFGVGGTTEASSLATVAFCFASGNCAGLVREEQNFSVLLAAFDTPTDFVEISGSYSMDVIDGYAFDASFRLLRERPTSVNLDPSCYTTGLGLCKSTISFSMPQANISYFLAGSFAGVGFLDHLRFNRPASSVPEPGTLALFGMALLGMGVSRRK